MKITDIRTFLMRAGAPERHEVATGGAPAERMSGLMTQQRHWLFVKIYTDKGIVGIGECSGWPLVVQTAVNDLKPLLIGEDPADIERL